MKYLKIENNKGFYCVKEDDWIEIDKINKEDLMALIDKAIETEFEMDEFNQENIANKAHQIIYKNLYDKFQQMINESSDVYEFNFYITIYTDS